MTTSMCWPTACGHHEGIPINQPKHPGWGPRPTATMSMYADARYEPTREAAMAAFAKSPKPASAHSSLSGERFYGNSRTALNCLEIDPYQEQEHHLASSVHQWAVCRGLRCSRRRAVVSNFIQTRASHSAKCREGGPRSAKKEYSHEGRINHRSAIRCSDLRDGSNFPAGNITRCGRKYRYCASHHLWPRTASKPSSGSSRLPPNSACCSSRRYHPVSVR